MSFCKRQNKKATLQFRALRMIKKKKHPRKAHSPLSNSWDIRKGLSVTESVRRPWPSQPSSLSRKFLRKYSRKCPRRDKIKWPNMRSVRYSKSWRNRPKRSISTKSLPVMPPPSSWSSGSSFRLESMTFLSADSKTWSVLSSKVPQGIMFKILKTAFKPIPPRTPSNQKTVSLNADPRSSANHKETPWWRPICLQILPNSVLISL